MTKSEIIEKLKTKFEGVSDEAIGKLADRIEKTNKDKSEEEQAAAVEAAGVSDLLESYSDYRATTASQTAVKNYEKKHGLKDGKKENEPADPKQTTQDTKPANQKGGSGVEENKEVDELKKQIESLTNAVNGLVHEKVSTGRKGRLSETLKPLPESIRKRYEKDFAKMQFETDEDFETYLEELTSDVEGISTDLAGKGLASTPPKGGSKGGNEDKPSDLMKKRIEARKESLEGAPKTAAIKGIPTEK